MIFVVGWCGFCYRNSYSPHNGHKSYPPNMVKISELSNLKLPPANHAIKGYYVILYCKYLGIPGVGYGLNDISPSKNDM